MSGDRTLINIPPTVFGLLCLMITTLSGVIIWQQKRIDRLYEKIEVLFEARLTDSKEVAKDVTAVLQGNSQANLILAEKIEVAKERGTL